MSKFYQQYWNKRIRESKNPAGMGGPTIARLAREGGEFWKYEQSPHNTDAYREGWERTFGNKKEEK